MRKCDWCDAPENKQTTDKHGDLTPISGDQWVCPQCFDKIRDQMRAQKLNAADTINIDD